MKIKTWFQYRQNHLYAHAKLDDKTALKRVEEPYTSANILAAKEAAKNDLLTSITVLPEKRAFRIYDVLVANGSRMWHDTKTERSGLFNCKPRLELQSMFTVRLGRHRIVTEFHSASLNTTIPVDETVKMAKYELVRKAWYDRRVRAL